MGAPGRDDLPIADYDHLPIGGLGHRIRSLTADELRQLLEFERAHGKRLPAVQLMEQRLRALDAGATPSGGNAGAPAVETAPAPDCGGTVSPATAGPAQNPPSHGVPTNPAQPRTTG